MKISEQIKERVTIPDILTVYGYPLGRTHQIPCMLHGGKKNNFGYNDKIFHCFVCGAKGDVVGLVKQLFGLDFRQAVIKINEDFGLHLTDEKPSLKQIAAERKKVKERKQARLERMRLREEYLEQLKVYEYLQKFIYKYHPTDPDQDPDEWHPVFIYAAQNLAELEYWLDENIGRMEVSGFG